MYLVIGFFNGVWIKNLRIFVDGKCYLDYFDKINKYDVEEYKVMLIVGFSLYLFVLFCILVIIILFIVFKFVRYCE